MKWILFFALFSHQVIAQDAQPSQAHRTTEAIIEKIEDKAVEVQQNISETSSYRANSTGTALVGFEPFSSWLPLKLTASYTQIFNKKWSLEAEFARGKFGAGLLGFDLASVTEYRYSILARRYIGNSFHWIFGVYKDDLKARLGNDITDSMNNTRIDDLKVSVLGGTVGVGNRWQWQKGFTVGIDWFRMNMPLLDRETDDGVLKYIDNENDYDLVKRGMDRVAKIPTFVLMGIYLGYTF